MKTLVRSLSLLLVFFLLGSPAFAQSPSVSGQIKDKADGSPLPGVYITVFPVSDSTQATGSITDTAGRFQVMLNHAGTYHFRASFIGYQNVESNIDVVDGNNPLGTLQIGQSSTSLSVVTVAEAKNPTEIIGDTVQYNSAAFKTNPDANAEDLITKMPGVTNENGTIKVNGEQIKKVTVDGKPFFGDDPSMALKNLPAEVIDKVQVFDKGSDQSQFTGFDDGNTDKAINIVTKKGKNNGVFGKIYGGYGYGDDHRYLAGGNINYFNGARRISLLGMTNNINQQNFSSEDLLGIGSSGGGGRRGGGSGAGNFLVGGQSGIATTNSLGLNYSDNWGAKVQVTGSYFFNLTNNVNTTSLTRSYVSSQDNGLQYNENDSSQSKNYNHRLNLRIEYAIDSNNKLIFTPKASFQKNNATSTTFGSYVLPEGVTESATSNTTSNDNKGYDAGASLLFQHKFSKTGRTFSLNTSFDQNNKNGNSSLYSESDYIQLGDTAITDQHSNTNTKGYTISATASYTEPVGKSGQIQLSYSPSYTNNQTDKETYNLDSASHEYSLLDTSLSNKYNNNYLANNGGVGYRLHMEKLNFMVGVNAQYATLNGDETYPYVYQADRNFFSVLPKLMFNYKFTKTKNLRFFYRTATDVPSISQLQNVINNSNPLQLSTGNPDLKQDYEHSFNLHFSQFDAVKSRSLFFLVSAQYTQNYIGQLTLIPTNDTTLSDGTELRHGSQLTKPVNLNGYVSARGFFTYGLTLKKIKSNLNLHTSFSYTRTPGLVNNIANVSNNYSIGQGIVLSSNISEKIDFTLSYNPSYNIARNTYSSQSNSNYFSQVSSVKFNWLFWKGFVFNTSASHTFYSGLSSTYDQSYLLWNLGLGYKFLKDQSLQVMFNVNDVLAQNKSISRTVTESYIEDSRTNALTRYFMLTLTYTLRKFKGTSQMPADTEKRPMDGPMDRGNWHRGGDGGPPPSGPPPGGGPGGE